MIKNCNVLINNEAVTVIDYDGIQVQIPSIHKEAKSVKIVAKNGTYTVVDDNYIEPEVESVQETATQSKSKKKTVTKKTTLDESADNTKTDSE